MISQDKKKLKRKRVSKKKVQTKDKNDDDDETVLNDDDETVLNDDDETVLNDNEEEDDELIKEVSYLLLFLTIIMMLKRKGSAFGLILFVNLHLHLNFITNIFHRMKRN